MESCISTKERKFGISEFEMPVMIIYKTTAKCVVCLHWESQNSPPILNVKQEGLAIEDQPPGFQLSETSMYWRCHIDQFETFYEL